MGLKYILIIMGRGLSSRCGPWLSFSERTMEMRFLVIFVSLFMRLLLTAGQEAEWVSLFNGRDLAGWKIHGKEKWTVEGGAIVGETVQGGYGYLATEKSFRDFDLRLRFKVEGGGNSGVFFRSTMHGEDFPGLIEGTQVEVDADPTRHTGGLYENPKRRWLIWPTAACEAALDSDGWNELELTAEGNHIVTHLNGVRCVEFVDPKPQHTEGIIALQIHSVAASQLNTGAVKVRWKDLYSKDLSTEK